ncbi:hypothetical protein [Nocardia pseudobrasiliensis]|uniref:hypothetical protein n=1 Tax=Nocardia pseudobrasiliensis TaxID=45979 RepID=UPI00157DE634|nr:hypothetical protein [Nocardia pseudobrasiliensis]
MTDNPLAHADAVREGTTFEHFVTSTPMPAAEASVWHCSRRCWNPPTPQASGRSNSSNVAACRLHVGVEIDALPAVVFAHYLWGAKQTGRLAQGCETSGSVS